MQDLDKTLWRVISAYQAAVQAKDVAALMKLYDPKVRVFDAWGVWVYEGAPAWQLAVESWFTSLGTEKLKVGFDDVQLAGSQELASVSAVVTYAGLSAQDEPLRSMNNRLSWVLKTSGHVLRVVHEHSSAPIGFDDMKAILVRAPKA